MTTFHVDGIPKPQPRAKARAFRVGAVHVAQVYNPKDSNDWKQLVVLAARPHRPAIPSESPFAVRIVLHLPRPQRLCRRKDPPHPLLCDTAGDCDNYAKAVLDCLTQIGWWRDDKQVAVLIVRKLFHAKDGRPGAEITIEELSPVEEPASQPVAGPSGAGQPQPRGQGGIAEDLEAAGVPPGPPPSGISRGGKRRG